MQTQVTPVAGKFLPGVMNEQTFKLVNKLRKLYIILGHVLWFNHWAIGAKTVYPIYNCS